MIYDFLKISKEDKTPVYQQIYNAIKLSIEKGNLKKGVALPSIRKLSSALGVSKTTIESAYHRLCCEGYIRNIPQSGYLVEAEFSKLSSAAKSTEKKIKTPPINYEYDFGSKSVDIANFPAWKKYVKDVLNKPYLLTSYGDTQGEPILRNALQNYSFSVRGINADEEMIVIGAGMQTLLYTLCGLLPRNKTVALQNGAYPQAEQIFKDFGFDVNIVDCDDESICLETLEKLNSDIVLVNPNTNLRNGTMMPVQRRVDLINWAKRNNKLIIEDDYNGELRYTSSPMPAIQSYCSDNVVYLCSFSKLLLPSVRISYMVMPPKLKALYDKVSANYNQTASKLEQLAIADYISDGKLEAHLRKLRKTYYQKSRELISSLKRYIGNEFDYVLNETSLSVAFNYKNIPFKKVYSQLQDAGFNTVKSDSERYNIILSFSGIEFEKIDSGIKRLSDILNNIK